jgi:hypothetical protein
MCLLESNFLKEIDTREFLNQAWIKGNAKHIVAMIDHFNKISMLVVNDIVKAKDTAQRVNIINHWISIAEKCKDLGNFESVMEIMSGLSNSCVSRLTKTWAVSN